MSATRVCLLSIVCALAVTTAPAGAVVGGEHFDARRMLCAIDVDGLEPLSSGCNGDSGGPLYTGTAATPVLLGVVSCGVTASNDGGIADAPFASSAMVKIPR